MKCSRFFFTSLHMFGIRRRRRFVRLVLCIAVIALLIYFIRSNLGHFAPQSDRIDLRKHHSNFEIISPITEPRGYLEQPLFLFVIVSSSPNKRENVDRRNMIRQTWGNFKKTHKRIDQPWKVVFMMGKSSTDEMNQAIMAENEKYGDLLIGDYKDDYRSITTKLLMAFKWASQMRCNYVLKADDDVYIDIPKLIDWLNAYGNQRFYGGVVFSGMVVRDRNHRHFVSREELPLDIYPEFCKGAMSVLSWSLIPKLVELSKKVTRISPDDAYIGILANQLGIYPVRIDGFFQAGWLPWFLDFMSLCQLRNLLAIGDSLSPDQVNYVHQVKTSLSNSERFYTVCISLHMKFFLLLLFICACFLACCYKRCCGRNYWLQ